MRKGLAASAALHLALIAWGLFTLPPPKPLDASQIEAIPVDLVPVAETTKLDKGSLTAAIAPKPAPKPSESEKPVPAPPPPPPPKPTPPVPPQPPKPEPPPTPPPPKPAPPPPEPTPPPPPTPTPPPPEPTPPAPTADSAPTPPPPTPTPHLRPNRPAPPPPAETAAATPPKPTPAKPAATPAPPTPAKKTFDADKIAALLDVTKPAPAPAPPAPTPPALGANVGAATEHMTQNELDALRARISQCWSPPIGWTDPSEVRVVMKMDLNQDGSVAGDPQVVAAPGGRYAQTAPESAARAIRRCAPYVLPPEKYSEWREIQIVFDPTDMAAQ